MDTGRRPAAGELTGLLQAWSGGDPSALDRLTPMVYSELRRLAHLQMTGERQGHVLQPSALVNEAFVRLMEGGAVAWANRYHFYAASARLMRRILVDFARAEEAGKRGGRIAHANVAELDNLSRPRPAIAPEHLIAVDEALNQLEKLDERQSKVVELRFFGGLENGEIGSVLGITERTVLREWRLARAFLFQSLGASPKSLTAPFAGPQQ